MFIIFCAVIFSLVNCCCSQLTERAMSAELLLNISKNIKSQGGVATMADNLGPGSSFDLVPSMHRDIGFQIHHDFDFKINCG